MSFRFDIKLLGSVVLLVSGLLLLNCAPKPKYQTPALGEKVSIAPIAVNQELPQNQQDSKKALKLNVMWGGRALLAERGDPTLYFYDGFGNLKFSYKWSDLEIAYQHTGCSESMVSSLNGYLMGAALICDGSLNLDGISLIRAVDQRGEAREATSWGAYNVSEEVTAVSIGLY